mmetsp:Transcript_106398/g.297935  ORF Transcript_106398/g.297935 Transcript_106398/m.297935 type:complete len:308 (-) Transcript_106398:1329-2252(-)
MGRLVGDVLDLQGDVQVVLLVDVDPLEHALLEEVLERHAAGVPGLQDQRHVLRRVELRLAVLHDDERPTEPAGVRGDEDGMPALVLVDGDELANTAPSAQELQVGHELLRAAVHAEEVAVEDDEVDAHVVHLLAGERQGVLDPQAEAYRAEGLLALARGDVRQQGEVLHEAALLALGGVRGAQHAPLRGLQRPGPGDLAILGEGGLDAHHGADAGHVGEAGEHLRHPGPLDPVPLDVPVPRGDRVVHGLGEPRPVRPQLEHVWVRRQVPAAPRTGLVPLGEVEVRLLLKLRVHVLELVLEEHRDEGA